MEGMTPVDRLIYDQFFKGSSIIKNIDNSEYTGFHIVNNHLQTIWGERANWKENYKRYIEQQKIKHGTNLEIPTITFEDIKKMIIEEEEYSNNIEAVKAIYKKENKSDKDIIELSNILGIGPRPIDNPIYKYLVNYEEISDTNIELVYSTKNLVGLLDVIIMSLMRQYEEGMLITVPPNTSVMRQIPGKYYYRGENDIYSISGPSIYRLQKTKYKYKKMPENVKGLVNDLMMAELSEFLFQFDAVKSWGYSTVNVYAIAQHYGISTKMLDITSNIKTALFFMTCVEKNGEWRPLTQKDMRKKRYGVLFRSPSELTILNRVLNENEQYEVILPIGYQPFMRCSTQYGYFIASMNEKFNLYNHHLFEKYKIELNEEICEWAYNEMDGGNNIYPQEDIPDISEELKKIEKTHQFSRDIFEVLMDKTDLKPIEEILLKDLKKYGYGIIDTRKKYLPNHRINLINKHYTPDRVRELMKTELKIQPMSHISSDILVNDDGILMEES